MESPPSSPQFFGGIVQLARSAVVRVAEKTPVAVQPATLLAVAKSHNAEEDDSACTSECSSPESSRGIACRSPAARAAIGGRAQHVRGRGERGEWSLKDMIRRANGQAKIPPATDRIKSCEEFLGRATK